MTCPTTSARPSLRSRRTSRRASITELLLAFGLLAACHGKSDPEPKDAAVTTPLPPPSTTPTASAFFEVRKEPLPYVEAGTVLAPVDAGDGYVLFARADGTIAAPQPTAPGWSCREKSVKDPAVGQMRMIDCTRRRAGELFFLLAKTYTVDAREPARTAEELSKNEYRADYAKFFQKVTYTREGRITYRGLPGYEVAFDAVHATKGPVRKLERVVTVGPQVFLGSAVGSPEAFTRYKKDTEAWMAGATFSDLPASPR
jgi:hypothetical protein